MGVKIATTCLHWSQSISSPPSTTSSSHYHHYNRAASSISPPPPNNSNSSSSRRRNSGNKQTLVCRVVHGPYHRSSTLFQSTSSSSTILRTQSCEFPKSKSRNQTTIRRSLSTNNTEGFSDEEFQKEIKELAKRFEIWDDEDDNGRNTDAVFNCRDEDEEEEEEGDNINTTSSSSRSNSSLNEDSSRIVSNSRSFPSSKMDSVGPPWLGIRPDPPEWTGLYDMIPASIARKANSVDIPFSLRMLKRKTQWQEGFREAGESACCSLKKAFSSMVFIIRELQSYTLQMRQVLLYEDLQEILVRVQKEMNASFVWLFQQIFSHTPTLMVYVMILLANFTVYSMAQNTAIAGIPTMEAYGVTTEIVSMKEDRINPVKPKYDPSVVMKMTIISGNKGGGGNNIRSVTGSGTDGEDGRIDGLSSFTHHEIVSDEISKVPSFVNPTTTEETEVGKKNQGEMGEEDRKLWNSVLQEAYRMQAVSRDETLDQETMQRFVSPIKVDIEPEDYSVYARTELLYKEAVSREPTNSTILSNYAQFLYLVIHDHDRAEEYFKRAALVEPADAEALSRYANFLWLARKDIGAAEETYIGAIEADPGNTFHAGNYAHFLWNTGGEDTCYYEPEASNEA